MIELISAIVFGALLSIGAFFVTRNSLKISDDTDIIQMSDSKEITKKKNNSSSKSKQKKLKTESLKTKQSKNNKIENQSEAPLKPILKIASDVPEHISNSKVVLQSDNLRKENVSTEWKEVSKGSKKSIKKDTKSVETAQKKVNEYNLAKKIEVVEQVKPETTKKEEKKKVISEVMKKESPIEVTNVQVLLTETPVTNTKNEGSQLRRQIDELQQENDKLRSQKEDNKLSNNAVNALNKEIDSLKSKLKTKDSIEAKLNEDIQKRTTSINDLKTQFQIVQKELTKNIVVSNTVKDENIALKKKIENLEEINRQLQEQLSNVQHEQEALKQQIKSETLAYYNGLIQQRDIESTQQVSSLKGDNQRQIEQIMRLQSDHIEQSKQMQSTRQELDKLKSSQAEVMNDNMRLQKLENDLKMELNKVSQHLKENENNIKVRSIEEINKLENNIKDLENKNSSILKENAELKSSAASAQSESVESNKTELTKLENRIKELEDKNSVILNENAELKSSFAAAQSKSTASNTVEMAKLNEDITELQNQLKDKTKQCMDLKNMSDDFKQSISQMQDKIANLQEEVKEKTDLVENYKNGLQNTEDILSRLQKSVNDEEEKWRDSLMKSEAEAEKCKKELERAFNDLLRIKNSRTEKNELNFAYHCVDKSLSTLIDEMESEMKKLESSLENVIQERDDAITQNKATSPQVQNGVHEINNSESGDKLELLRQQLSDEVERNTTLQNQCNKYQALVQIGHDTLEAEKSKFDEWKKQINSTNNTTTGVNTSDDSEPNATESIHIAKVINESS